MNKKNIKLKRILFFITLFLFVLGLFYLIFIPSKIKVEVATVRLGTFQETIDSDGVLRSKERYIVPAFADGDIKRIPLKVGDVVKKGDVLTELFWSVKYLPVRAPISGVISKLFRESAGPIRRGDPILEIIDPSQLEVMCELLTTDATRLSVGSILLIDNWEKGPPLEGRVTRISKAGFTKLSALGVEEERTEVIGDLMNNSQDILKNIGSTFHVDVTFKISEKPNVLLIPVGAIFRDGKDWAVYVVENGRAKNKKVEIGQIGTNDSFIKSGLKKSQKVILYPGDLVKDGSRIELQEK